ncbi:hypothetical protein SAMN02982931_03348 [Bauldia litoralis]|uniref:Uncharacterized protein n=1 Tax=Bauldia litoralis TaxID=665467 RepID=A0A1G6DG67_9HYPH|nr:hypothetical protein SAMN02982931_03348 [Bauldia litoralis]
MKALAIIVNIFVPGSGTIIVGKLGQGAAQFLLFALGIVLTFAVAGPIVGVPLAVAAWVWALDSAAGDETVTSRSKAPRQTENALSFLDRRDRHPSVVRQSPRPIPQADRSP